MCHLFLHLRPNVRNRWQVRMWRAFMAEYGIARRIDQRQPRKALPRKRKNGMKKPRAARGGPGF